MCLFAISHAPKLRNHRTHRITAPADIARHLSIFIAAAAARPKASTQHGGVPTSCEYNEAFKSGHSRPAHATSEPCAWTTDTPCPCPDLLPTHARPWDVVCRSRDFCRTYLSMSQRAASGCPAPVGPSAPSAGETAGGAPGLEHQHRSNISCLICVLHTVPNIKHSILAFVSAV